MTIVPSITTTSNDSAAVSLARYAQLISYPECQFFGVNNPASIVNYLCRKIWTKPERDNIERYLLEAQTEIEEKISYKLQPTWIEGEEHKCLDPLVTNYGYVRAVGTRATAVIAASETVSHATDPAVIGPVATTVTDADEIHVYHPGSNSEIYPSAMTLSGGNVTIYVPRCRMVTLADQDNDENGLDYSDTTGTGPFEQTVDITRVYNDTTDQVDFIHRDCHCGQTSNSGCAYIKNDRIGIISVRPATCSCVCGCQCDKVLLNYCSGRDLTIQLEDAIIRLAHSRMPQEPCGCDQAMNMWTRDRNIPAVLTAERINCPFGLSDGAWAAWQIAISNQLVRSGVMSYGYRH